MTRKGISPLIAAVLMIAFTMAVAALFAQWAPQLTEDAMGEAEDEQQEIQACSNTMHEVEADEDNDQFIVRQTQGDINLGDVQLTAFDENGDVETETVTLGEDEDETRETETVEGSSLADGQDIVSIETDPTECEGAPSREFNWDDDELDIDI